ncbi:MAG TPA: hypothetical protein VLC09_05355, partial [Polyangiaceae bacterium]|nr:hypothetical protein [Polyangiaceae bacterium]
MASVSEKELTNALNSAGGFAWWYLDLTSRDDDGSLEGLVLIWSLGLPFLSGSRTGPIASSRPSLSLAIYRAGVAQLYLLQQHDSWSHLEGVHGSLRMGASLFEVSCDGESFDARILLDEPVPGSSERLQGAVRVGGPAVSLRESPGSLHVWSPRVLEGSGQARLRFGSKSWEISGSAYFDGNVSAVPLHEQSIESWRWGRFHCAGRTWVFYDVRGEQEGAERRLVLTASATEPATARADVAVSFAAERRGRYGMVAPRRIELAGQ